MQARRDRTQAAELVALLAPLQRRLWWRHSLRLVLRTLTVGLGVLFVAGALATLGLAPPPDTRLLLVVGGVILGVLALAIARRPSLLATARAVDRTVGLADRLGTAVELATRGPAGALAVVQIADATAVARRLRPADAVPLAGARHDALLTLGLALLTAGTLLLAGLGDGRPSLLVALRHLLGGDADHVSAAQATVPPGPTDRAQLDSRLAPLLEQLESLRANEATLSPEEVAARRAAAAQQLADLAATSRTLQEALAELARALQGAAAGREVAENLLQGDYQRAAEALKALGRDSDQLSQAGRRQLAEALRQAQAGVRPLSPELAERVQRAAQALGGRDYRRTERALDELADAVAQAGRGVVPQGDLGLLGEALAEQGADLEAVLAALGALGLGSNPAGDGGPPGPAGAGPPGTLPGAADPAAVARLGAPGAPLPLESLPSLDGLPGLDAPDPDRPSVLAPVSIGTTTSTAPAAVGGPLSAPGETAPVPTERREVVRGYFGAGR